MAKQYDRLLDRSEGKRKQDIRSFDDYLWRLKVAINRVQCLFSYRWEEALKTVDEVLKKTEKLSNDLEEWRNSVLNDGKKTIQLGALAEAVEQLEDMADDIEYTRCKQRLVKFGMKTLNLLPYATERSRSVFILEKNEELLHKLHGIIEDFQKEYSESLSTIITESGTGSALQDYTASTISEGQTSNEITAGNDSHNKNSNDGANIVSTSEDLLRSLCIEQGDLVIAYRDAQGTEKSSMPVDNIIRDEKVRKSSIPVNKIIRDEKVRQKFELLLSVRASDRPMSTVSPHPAKEKIEEQQSIILKLMNSSIVHVEGVKACRCSDKKHAEKEGSSNMSQGVEVNKAQELIEEFSKGKMFLLLLEDVSKDQLPQLRCLLSALSRGNSGSKIVISSKSSEVLKSLRGIKIANQINIGDSIFWYFFRTLALTDERSGTVQKENEKKKEKKKEKEKEWDENLGGHGNLEDLGKVMSRHLIKFPLAATMVAKMLNTKRDHQFWAAISEKVRRVVESVDCEHLQLLLLLKICYDELPAPLRLCFQYCSLFPENWTFTSESLVQLWMSQGFLVKNSDEVGTLEDEGQRYFRDLHSRSFLEKITDDDHTSFYSLHKVVHSFAQATAGENFMRIESDLRPGESLHVRHLSVKSVNLSALHNVDAIFNLRTLIIFGPVKYEASKILDKILPRLRKTRTLDLTGCDMKTFPKLTGDLRKHLRFLSIYGTGVQKLPDGFCEFLHLQSLNILGSRLKKLPNKTTRLRHLRHISGPTFLTSEMRQIGKLKALQELENFPVSKTHGMKDLGGIKDLRGSITISNLEKVCCTAAAKARLCDKGNLNSLKLEWSSKIKQKSKICGFIASTIKSYASAKVLERLKPPSALSVLEINRYFGRKCPSWFTTGALKNIADIRLSNCENWKETPPLGDLPNLNTLKLENCDKFASFGNQKFKKLIELFLEGMPELNQCGDCDGGFPLLEMLTIKNCPKLNQIPLLTSPNLTEIHVENVGLVRLPLRTVNMPGNTKGQLLTRLIVRDCSDLTSVGGDYSESVYLPSSLLYIQVTGCMKIEHIRLRLSTSLEELLIKNCSKLMKLETDKVGPHSASLPTIDVDKIDEPHFPSLPNESRNFAKLRTVHVDNISLLKPHYEDLLHLEELTIEDEELMELNDLAESLHSVIKKLCFINCTKLEALPDMKQFSALRSLQLKQCHKIKTLPFLPYSMDVLRIDDCPLLEKQCREDGPAWSMISHVPYKYI